MYRVMHDTGTQPDQIHKVKAHTTKRDVLQGLITKEDQEGNAGADNAAKRGASMHPSDDATSARYYRIEQTVSIFASHIGRLVTARQDTEEPPKKTFQKIKKGKISKTPQNYRTHQPVWDSADKIWRCDKK